jgi:hypothetical protein
MSRPACATPYNPLLEKPLGLMDIGITDLNQAAKSGDPMLLREAEREVLEGLIQALGASGVQGRLNASRYQAVYRAENRLGGLFPALPYHLEVLPDAPLPPFWLTLRRSPWPLFQFGRRLEGWRIQQVPGGVRLSTREN